MNQASAWRVELARTIAAVYAENPQVRMVALGGSAARGTADAFSDMDMAVYWQPLDDAYLDAAPLARSGAERFTFRRLFEGQVALEQYYIGPAKLDVVHFAMGWWEQTVADVTERADLADEKHEVLDGFMGAIALHGLGEYERWRERIGAFPDALAHAMVARSLRFYPEWVLAQHGLARGDLLNFYAILCEMIGNLLGVLAGLNRLYHSMEKPKHSAELLRRMQIVPANAAARLEALLAGERERAPAELAALVDETLALVEQHMPAVDTTRARMIQRMPATPVEQAPPFPRA